MEINEKLEECKSTYFRIHFVDSNDCEVDSFDPLYTVHQMLMQHTYNFSLLCGIHDLI